MGQDKGVDPPYFAVPQKGGDDILSGIETVIIKPSSVNEHPLPAREFNKNGISLPDIDKTQPEIFLERIF